MRRLSGEHALVAVLRTLAMSVSTSVPLASVAAVSALAEHHALAEELGRHGTGPTKGQASPDAHCHSGVDRIATPALASTAAGLLPAPVLTTPGKRLALRYPSVTLSPQPPPPRAVGLSRDGQVRA